MTEKINFNDCAFCGQKHKSKVCPNWLEEIWSEAPFHKNWEVLALDIDILIKDERQKAEKEF